MKKKRAGIDRSVNKSGYAVWRPGQEPLPSGQVVALIPGADAPMLSVKLPASLKGNAREDVAIRQIRDRLSETVLTSDVRPARLGDPNAWNHVVVADQRVLSGLRRYLVPIQKRCKALIPDYLSLPTAKGIWTIDVAEDSIQVRMGPYEGFSAEADLAIEMLRRAIFEATAAETLPRAAYLICETERCEVVGEELARYFSDIPIYRALDEIPPGIRPKQFAFGELEIDFGHDLRADAADVEHRIRRMIWPFSLIVLGTAAWVVATLISIERDVRTAQAITEEVNQAALRDILPPGPVLDVRVQVTREIERLRLAQRSSDFQLDPLRVISAASEVLSGHEHVVRRISLDPGVEGVSISLQTESFRTLDSLVAQMREAGLAVRIRSSSLEQDGVVRAEISILGVDL